MKAANGIIHHLEDDRLELSCGRVNLKARARLAYSDAGQYLTGIVIEGPAVTLGRSLMVGTTNFIDAHVHIHR